MGPANASRRYRAGPGAEDGINAPKFAFHLDQIAAVPAQEGVLDPISMMGNDPRRVSG